MASSRSGSHIWSNTIKERAERANKYYEEYYEKMETIGNGTFGTVYKGKEKEKDELRAIKVIDLQGVKASLTNQYSGEDLIEHLDLCLKGFISEFEIMKLFSNCENSVKCYEYFNNENNFAIIMELCDSNLSKLLAQRKKNDGEGFSSEEILEIMKQLNEAFKIMKENNITHRDLKLENILIKYLDEENKKFIIKLSDYDSSKRLSSLSSKNYLNSINGTVPYMAPEILKGEEYNYKVDLWSIGIILYKLYFGIFPYNGPSEFSIINKIEKSGKEILKKTDNKDLDDLIMNLLEKDPSKRFTWDQYFNHSFFEDKNINKIQLIYECEKKEKCDIFGEIFVMNNRNNIELVINGIKSELIEKYKLKEGKNIIEIIIKNKILSLEYMFYNCESLRNIDGLKYLDVKGINNFYGMFNGCSSLSDLKPLQNWNVSNGNDFHCMFSGCS